MLEAERERIGRQIASVTTTLRKTREGRQLMPEEAFDGFDHTQYEEEVTRRWGTEAYQQSDRWWRSLSAAVREASQQQQHDIAADVGAAHQAGWRGPARSPSGTTATRSSVTAAPPSAPTTAAGDRRPVQDARSTLPSGPGTVPSSPTSSP